MISIQKFRIMNYKSIKDSGDCYLSDNVTIFAGKNESGKSSILEALQDFHKDREIRSEAVPIENTDLKPEIHLTLVVDKETVNEMLGEIIEDPQALTNNVTIEIIKTYPQDYSLSDATIGLLKLSTSVDKKNQEAVIVNVNNLLSELKTIIVQNPSLSSGVTLPVESTDLGTNVEEIKSQITAFKKQLSPYLPQIADVEQHDRISNLPDEIIKELDGLDDIVDEVELFVEKFVSKYLPYFILYSSFDDVFPDSIKKSELADNVWAKDLESISNFKIDQITSSDAQQRRNHAESTNVEFSEVFKQYWTQDDICLEVHPDEDSIYFYIKDNINNRSYKPAQRSKGQQWYLGFYTKVVARIREDVSNVILIDEPGLYLHAKAQKDLLKVFEKHAKDNGATVLFSTHSPYLISDEELERVRLVERLPKKGTLITGKLHTHPTASKETLTPLLTAIGLGANDGIGSLNKYSVIVEGPSDVFYLRAFAKLLNNNKYSFINGGGAGNMPFVGTITQGWGSKTVYLFDNDQGKTDGESNLIKNWAVIKEEIESVVGSKGSIEDIFSPDDFKKLVLANESATYTSSNSEYVKKSKKDKVLLARLFLQNINKAKIDSVTKKNAEGLFSRLDEKFKLIEA